MALQYTELDHDRFLRSVHQIMQFKYRRGNLKLHQEVDIVSELICEGRLARAVQMS